MTRRFLLAFLGASAALALLALPAPAVAQAPASPKMTVYKSPTCGCCAKWVEHMRKAGFDMTVNEVPNVGEVKVAHHVPTDVASCHTAIVGGYVIEGHVPADVILQMLKEKPKIVGLAVPGMPVGAPGMEGDGSTKEHYDIVAFTADGKHYVYASR
jgi:hypothetical protein